MTINCTYCFVSVCFVLCREKTTSFTGAVPEVVAVSAWDGKDSTIAVDEVPLDELFKD